MRTPTKVLIAVIVVALILVGVFLAVRFGGFGTTATTSSSSTLTTTPTVKDILTSSSSTLLPGGSSSSSSGGTSSSTVKPGGGGGGLKPNVTVKPAAPVTGELKLNSVFKMQTSYIVDISPLNDGTNRVWLAGKDGKIMIGDPRNKTFTDFMNISNLVDDKSEAGLYSIAPHPDFATNGFFVIKYATNDNKVEIARGNGKTTADPGSLQNVLTIDHVNKDQKHHYGGSDRFGPDGLFYISMGDTEAKQTAKDTKALQGKILRIDVSTAAKAAYTIPPGNPFKNEVLHSGLRNPYSLCFGSGGEMWVTIVGQSKETLYKFAPDEVGKNLGWPDNECSPTDCPAGVKAPEFSFGKDLGSAIIGGCFYTGSVYPALKNCYIFAGFEFGGPNPIYAWNSQTKKATKIASTSNSCSRIYMHSDETILVASKNELFVLG